MWRDFDVPKVITCKFILMHIYPRNCCKFTFHLIDIVPGSKGPEKKEQDNVQKSKGSNKKIPFMNDFRMATHLEIN